MKGVAPLISRKAYDADCLLQDLKKREATAVIPRKANLKVQCEYDTKVYKWRHMVENYFAKIKKFRGIAQQYDKTEGSYTAYWDLAATHIASRWLSTNPNLLFQFE